MKNIHPFMTGDSIWKEIFQELSYKTLVLNKGNVYYPDNYVDQIALLQEGLLKVFLSDAYG